LKTFRIALLAALAATLVLPTVDASASNWMPRRSDRAIRTRAQRLIRKPKPVVTPTPTPTPTSTPTTTVPTPDPTAVPAPLPTEEPTTLPSPGPTAAPSCVGTPVTASDNLQTKISAAAEGTTFCLGSGTYRLTQPLVPRNGQRFLGSEGTVLSGASVLTGWAPRGGTWVVGGQTATSAQVGECTTGTACRYNEDVYLDDRLLTRVLDAASVAPGKFFFDYANDEIVLGDDPSGHRVEVAMVPAAFKGSGTSGVTLDHLVVEKFANPAQSPAIVAGASWTVRDSEIRFNHGIGIKCGSNSRVIGNRVHHQGELGLAGSGTNILFENNEVDHNNTAGFKWGWEGGGAKWVKTDGLVVRGNFSHHNNGPGLWTDIDNIRTTYENNTVTDNAGPGIFHEISYDATITGNVLRGNGLGLGGIWYGGVGILVSASPNVEVYGNTLSGNGGGIGLMQQNRGTGLFGAHELHDVFVHDNDITSAVGVTGLVQNVADDSYFTSRNNRFESNTYHVANLDAKNFHWMNASRTKAEWKSYGQDANGSFLGI
jgi:parallel beta-helix repeat protein